MSEYEFGANEKPDHSPDGPQSKRRRIALACLECRRRKLKCDRVFPACTRCRKGGNPGDCTYDPEAIESIAIEESAEKLYQNGQAPRNGNRDLGNMTSPTSFVNHYALDADNSAVAALRAHVYRLENRIIGLEKAAHAPQPYYGFHQNTFDPVHRSKRQALSVAGREDLEAMMFRGKSFKTQFYGASHHTSCLSNLPELRNFMNLMIAQHPGLTHLQKELKGTKSKVIEGFMPDKEGKNLVQLLPGKMVIEKLIHIYLESFEISYRVLHLPSFFDEYYRCLEAPERTRPQFVALLLVMMAAANCAKPEGQSMLRGDSSLERENADFWIRATESWLALQSRKHINAVLYQIRVVSFIAKQVNAIKRKRIFTEAGDLARMAISAGLHRDAETVNLRHGNLNKRRVSLFDQEMRRRIWTTIAELELQTAIDRGMPAMMRDLIIDCGAPLNIEDEKLGTTMDQPLPSLSSSVYTKSSFQHISYSSFALRQEIVSLINGSSTGMSFEEMLQYDRKITEALDRIPAWNEQSHEMYISRALLQMQLLYLQLLIHRPFVHQDFHSKRYAYSAMVHLKSATIILDLHQNLIVKGNNILSLMRNDILAAVYSICYSFSTSGPTTDRRLSMSNGFSGDYKSYLESALAMSEDKVNRLGVGIQEYYSICAVIGLQEKQEVSGSPDPSCEYKAAERCSRMIKKMLSLQDNFSAAATLASLPNMPITSLNGQSDLANVLPTTGEVDQSGLLTDFAGDLDGFGISGWDLDSFVNF